VKRFAIPAPSVAELERLNPTRIFLLGGPRVVSTATEGGLERYTLH